MTLYDSVVIVPVGAAFFIFLVIHIGFFRFFPSQDVLRNLIQVFLIGGAAHIAAFIYYGGQQGIIGSMGLLSLLFLFVVSFLLYSCLAYIYTICVFGPYESSIRIRIVRELYRQYPKLISWKELSNHYNIDMILRRRLDRLVRSRDFIFDGKFYTAVRKVNMFSILKIVGKKLSELSNNQ